VIFGADRFKITAFDFVIVRCTIAPSNKAAALSAFSDLNYLAAPSNIAAFNRSSAQSR
jgi:hypothetical protein